MQPKKDSNFKLYKKLVFSIKWLLNSRYLGLIILDYDRKVGRIFRMVISSEFRMEYRDDDHRDDVPHFTHVYCLEPIIDGVSTPKFNRQQDYMDNRIW